MVETLNAQARRAKRGQHWQDEHGLVHRIKYTYPVGAVLLGCEEKVPKKSVQYHICDKPVSCLECLDVRDEIFDD